MSCILSVTDKAFAFSVIMLSVAMLSVVMLSVVAPDHQLICDTLGFVWPNCMGMLLTRLATNNFDRVDVFAKVKRPSLSCLILKCTKKFY